MNIKGIIAISGRPGLFKVVAQSKNSVIVESMIDKKRFPAYASEKISTLEDISIFTYDDVSIFSLWTKIPPFCNFYCYYDHILTQSYCFCHSYSESSQISF
jgi:hypothetical protein